MKIIIVGAGAMGSLVGGLMAESGADITLYDVVHENIAAIREKGLIIEHEGSRRKIRVNATDEVRQLGTADLLLILVKSYDTREAVQGVKSFINPGTTVLTLQNGLGNMEAIQEIVLGRQVLAGVTSHGAMLLEPGIVRHNGGAKTFIGSLDINEIPRAESAARILNKAGIDTSVTKDILGTIWTKLIVNAAINPLTAITGRFNGGLIEDGDLLNLMELIVAEATQVANTQNIVLQHQDMFEYVKTICQVTQKNKSSMLMDMLKKRPTEIDAINGKIVDEGEKYHIPTPVNRCVTHLIRSLERRQNLI